ncbi:PREDICTED: breast cancer type 1 susceptibility protein homolog [Habropoda laboriosa]|uniref:breast cancer type 1 susceptibility protein homolog n=1 Tax=Habropoda laboriosa TaxID=597456 RepID=UPI00083DEB88|nr:PREDICTED: breast cancer type 1 susceptibility protein homolog [Habropoda laboriosa]
MEQVLEKLSEVVRDMQTCLQCKICLSTISDPTKTLCGHVFCRTCIETVLQNKNAPCPLCKTIIHHRNISTDEQMIVYNDRFNKLIEAIKLDSGIDILTHLPKPRESSLLSNTEQYKLNFEEQIKPSCSYVNTSLPTRQPASKANRNTQKSRKKVSKDQKGKQKNEASEEGSITKYLSKCGFSGVEPLPLDELNDFQETTVSKVHSWLETLPKTATLDSPNRIVPLQSAEGDLDDTLTVSVSQNVNTRMENFDIDAAVVAESVDQGNIQNGRRSSRSSMQHENNEKDSNDKEYRNSFGARNEKKYLLTVDLNMDNQKPSTSGVTRASKDKERSEERRSEDRERSEERPSDVHRTSSCNMLPTMKQNWSSVVKFGKEMRTKRKKLRTLNVSIENKSKPRSLDESASNKDETVGLKLTKDTFPQSTPAKATGFQDLANLANESSSNCDISSLTPMKRIETIDESCSASKLQASPLNCIRLSLKRRSTDPIANDSSCSSADSRLQAVRRDLNHQIDQSDKENANARKRSAVEIIETEENGSSRSTQQDERGVKGVAAISSEFTSRRQENREQSGCRVVIRKLGKLCKHGKKRVKFLYLGPTRQKLDNPADALEQVCTSKNGFGNEMYITVNNTPTLQEEENNPLVEKTSKQSVVKETSVSKIYSVKTVSNNKLDDHDQNTKHKNLIEADNNDAGTFQYADTLIVSLDEVQPTQLPIERSIKSPKKTAANIKMLSPTKDSQLQFLSVESPSVDTLQTQILNHRSKTAKDGSPRRSSFSEIKGVHSRALIRASQQASTSSTSPGTPHRKRKRCDNREKLSDRMKRKSEEKKEESEDSNHSLSSQTTRLRNLNKEVLVVKKTNEMIQSSNPSTKDIEAMSLSSDTDVIASGWKKLHRRPLFDSSDDSPDIVCVNNVNDQKFVSPSSKRKRAISSDSDGEVNLTEILSDWYADTRRSEKCKKKGKVEEACEISNSNNVAKDNVSSKPSSSDCNKLINKLPTSSQNIPRSKLLYISSSVKSIFAGNTWRQTVEENALFDEDSPDFGETIDKIKDVRNKVIGESGRREGAVIDECLLHSNFDDIMANVDTDAFVVEYFGDKMNKREYVECLKQDSSDSNSKQEKATVVSVHRLNKNVSHTHGSNSSDKENKHKNPMVLNDSIDENERTLVPCVNVANKSMRKDKLQQTTGMSVVTGSSNDELLTKKSVVHMKDSYDQDSLMNITQHYLMMKQFEEDLLGKSKNSNTSIKKHPEKMELQTPLMMKQYTEKDIEHSGEEDDIVENTPDTKTKNNIQAFSSPKESSIASPITKISEMQCPIKTTPACKKSIHPLYQSTPKVQQSTSKDNYSTAKLVSNLNESTFSRQSESTVPSNVQSVSNVNKQRLCFVCSGLVPSQIEHVKRLAQTVNARYMTQFNQDVTHVIVKTDQENNGANKTLKYLQGIAYGKWIVSYQWVMDTLKERRLISEEPYEAVDSRTLEAGPRKSRLKEKDLFQGFAFLCIGPYDDVSVEQYQDLLRATGGIVVDSLDALAAEKKRWRVIVIQADIYDYEVIKWYKKTEAVPIVHDWIVECISRYRLISFYPYLQELSRQNVLDLGYPEFLVEEEPDGDSDTTADA